jgi:hypothetical protein
MRFRDVHHQKINLVSVLLVELIESGNLPPEWRSGVTAKNENDWLACGAQVRKLNGGGLIKFGEREVRRGVPNVKIAGAGMGPQSLKRECQKSDWTRQLRHKARESLRRLSHDVIKRTAGDKPRKSGNYDDCGQFFSQEFLSLRSG